MPVNWHPGGFAKSFRTKALDGCEEFMRADVMSDADEHCPVDKGTMRNSHTVERNDDAGYVAGGYGGAAAPYTRDQHEDSSKHHEVGEDHWLENAAKRNAPKLKDRIAEHTTR
jgi:hypothetical protein